VVVEDVAAAAPALESRSPPVDKPPIFFVDVAALDVPAVAFSAAGHVGAQIPVDQVIGIQRHDIVGVKAFGVVEASEYFLDAIEVFALMSRARQGQIHGDVMNPWVIEGNPGLLVAHDDGFKLLGALLGYRSQGPFQ
jgi:hypothetical protein